MLPQNIIFFLAAATVLVANPTAKTRNVNLRQCTIVKRIVDSNTSLQDVANDSDFNIPVSRRLFLIKHFNQFEPLVKAPILGQFLCVERTDIALKGIGLDTIPYADPSLISKGYNFGYNTGCSKTYTVAKDDTMSSIAKANGILLSDLVVWNRFELTLYVRQILCLKR